MNYEPFTIHKMRFERGSSAASNFVGLTGGVYKTRERIHRSLLICDYYRFRLHGVGLQTPI